MPFALALVLAACGPPADVEPSDGEPTTAEGLQDTGESAPPVQVAEIPSHPDDPQGWVPLERFEGQAVEVVREFHADGGLRRIVCYLAGQRIPDALHGPEWLQFKNGSPRARKMWVNGVNEGPFVAWFPSGFRKWEGGYSEGERDGIYRQFFPNSDLQQEFHYRKGEPHGTWREWNIGGHRAKEEHFVDGLREGVRREWGKGFNSQENPELAEEGNLVLEEHYVAGQRHGTWQDFWPTTGNLRTEGEYALGQRVGVWRRLHESGAQEAEATYVDDAMTGVQVIWDEAGNKVSEIEHLAGEPHGASLTWFDDGQLQAEGRLDQGLRVGPWSYWKADGSVDETWTGDYEDDQKVGD